MIEIRDTKADGRGAGVTYYCVECEQRLRTKVSCRYVVSDGWGKHLDRFWKAHDECGLSELDARLEKACPDYEDGVKFAEGCYLEDPQMKMEEIQRKYQEMQESLAGE